VIVSPEPTRSKDQQAAVGLRLEAAGAVPAAQGTGVSCATDTELSPGQLRRILGMKDLVLMIIGTVIGSGIFLVPGAVLRAVGKSVTLALTVWLSGGILSLFGALTYGELSAMKPKAGGLYVYIRDCFGTLPAFLFGWTLFFVISSGSIATLAVAFGNYLGELLSLSPIGTKAIAILVIVVITAVNIRGTRQSADLLNLTTAIKVAAILAVSGVLLWYGKQHVLGVGHNAVPPSSVLGGFGLAMISVLWAYEGWQYITYSAGETVNPQRTFPVAFLIGTGTLVAIYLLVNVAYLSALGPDGVSSSTRVAASALSVVVGRGAAKLITIAILISIFSAANSIMLNAPRVYYAMARNGLFFRTLAEVHPKFGTPAFAIAAAGAWSILLAASGTFEQLLTYVVFIGWIFYALAAASIFIYRKREPHAERPYKVPLYPLTPIIFIAAATALVVNTVATQPTRAAIGLGIVFLGAPAYAFWRRKLNPGGREIVENA
jgi:APA family basic amino acid/polyamine antiporter